MAVLLWLDKWAADTGEYIEEAELVFDTEDNATAAAQAYLAALKPNQRAKVQVVDWSDCDVLYEAQREVAE